MRGTSDRTTPLLALPAAATVFLVACQTGAPSTDLTGTAAYRGTVTLLRVDEACCTSPSEESHERPRFLPLLFKGEVDDLDTPERIVTDQDLVEIDFDSAFIKYFAEPDRSTFWPWGDREHDRRGEIAVVLSFASGEAVRESFIVFSAKGQTLGSFLNVANWPVIGPVRRAGDSLRLRVVLIEMDEQENASLKHLVTSIAGVAASTGPEGAVAAQILEPLARALIDLNRNDVILDHRFALQRIGSGRGRGPVPLLFGTYVLLLQEDRLLSRDVGRVASYAVDPPLVGTMRYDRASGDLYRTYPYLPVLGEPAGTASRKELAAWLAERRAWIAENRERLEEDPTWGPFLDANGDLLDAGELPAVAAPPEDPRDLLCPPYDASIPTLSKFLYEGSGPIDLVGWWDSGRSPTLGPPPAERRCILERWGNRQHAQDVRRTLGFRNPELADLETYNDFESAMKVAYDEGRRGIPRGRGPDATQNGNSIGDVPEAFKFDYRVTAYPDANVVLAQYPLHTHIVFTVRRSLGGETDPIHSRFQSFRNYVEEAGSTIGPLGEVTNAIDTALAEQRSLGALFGEVQGLGADQPGLKVCRLLSEIQDGEENSAASRRVFNEMFHVTGRPWTTREAAEEWARSTGCAPDGRCDGCDGETEADQPLAEADAGG